MTEYSEPIAENFNRIMDRINTCVAKCGRIEKSVKLLVVTKGQPVEKMLKAYEAGARLFGENYPEETSRKLEKLRNLHDIELHMIGHLQSRKAKIVAGSFHFMHSIDRLSIAEKLNRELEETGRKIPVLLEMNVSGEDTKNGFPAWDMNYWNDLLPVVEQINSYKALSIQGLMTMPPLSMDSESVRPFFSKLRDLREYFEVQFPVIPWKELSMGTSGDFETAIAEGATYIRIGTAIMGMRPKRI